MGKLLENLTWAFLIGVVLLVAVMVAFHSHMFDANYIQFWLRFFHVLSGVLWIGLLYYFNIVQIPTMPKVPADLKPGVSKYIAPEALFWFRWGAIATLLAGIGIAESSPEHYFSKGLMFQESYRVIGLGMWLGIIMAANVWFVIWPNQKKALGLVAADDETKAKSARIAMIASRTNFVLSIPMLYCMVEQAYLPR